MSEFNKIEQQYMLQTAKESIAYGILQKKPISVNLGNVSAKLLLSRASFVTLHKDGKLRGCIGTLQAYQPLLLDIANNAFNAALHDPRFKPVTVDELPHITLDISVLSNPILLQVTSEIDLLNKLRPKIDGLILSDKGQRATFLPSVWEQLPNPGEFIAHLKSKAGWQQDYWSDTLKVEIYTTELIK